MDEEKEEKEEQEEEEEEEEEEEKEEDEEKEEEEEEEEEDEEKEPTLESDPASGLQPDGVELEGVELKGMEVEGVEVEGVELDDRRLAEEAVAPTESNSALASLAPTESNQEGVDVVPTESEPQMAGLDVAPRDPALDDGIAKTGTASVGGGGAEPPSPHDAIVSDAPSSGVAVVAGMQSPGAQRRAHVRLTVDNVPTLANINLQLHLPPVDFGADHPEGVLGALRDLDGASHPPQRTTVVDGEVVLLYLLAQLPPFHSQSEDAAENLLASLQVGIDVFPMNDPSGAAASSSGPAASAAAATAAATAAAAAAASHAKATAAGGPAGMTAAAMEKSRRTIVTVDTRESHHDQALVLHAATVTNTSSALINTPGTPRLYRLASGWIGFPLRARVAAPAMLDDVVVSLVVTVSQRLLPAEDGMSVPSSPTTYGVGSDEAAESTASAAPARPGVEAKSISIDSVVQHLSRKAVGEVAGVPTGATSPRSAMYVSRRSLARVLSVVTPIAVAIETTVMADRRALVAVRVTHRLWEGLKTAMLANSHAKFAADADRLKDVATQGRASVPPSQAVTPSVTFAAPTWSSDSAPASGQHAGRDVFSPPPQPTFAGGSNNSGGGGPAPGGGAGPAHASAPSSPPSQFPASPTTGSSVAASLRLRASNLTASMTQALAGGHKRSQSSAPGKNGSSTTTAAAAAAAAGVPPPVPTTLRPYPPAPRPTSMAAPSLTVAAPLARRLTRLESNGASGRQASILGDSDWLRQQSSGMPCPWETDTAIKAAPLSEGSVPALRVVDVRMRLSAPESDASARLDLDGTFVVSVASDQFPMSLAPAETGATVAHLMLLGDELPAAVFALGRPCILTVTVQLQVVPRTADGIADSGPTTSPWPGFFNFSYQHPLDLVHLFGTMGPRRDFTLSLTADNAPVVVNQPFFVRIVIANDTATPHDLWLRMGDSLRLGRETKALPEKPGHGRMGPRASLISIGAGRATAAAKGSENLVAYSLENNVHLGYDPARAYAQYGLRRIDAHASLQRRLGFLALQPGMHVLPTLLVDATPEKPAGAPSAAVMLPKPLRVVVLPATLKPSSSTAAPTATAARGDDGRPVRDATMAW